MPKFTEPKLKHWLKATTKISTHTKKLLKKTLVREKNYLISALQNAIGNPQYAIDAAYDPKGAFHNVKGACPNVKGAACVTPNAIRPTSSWRRMIDEGGLKTYSLATETYALVIGILTLFIWYLFKYSAWRRDRCEQGGRNY